MTKIRKNISIFKSKYLDQAGLSYIQLIFTGSGTILVALLIFDRINIFNSHKNWLANNQIIRSELKYMTSYLKDSETCLNFLTSFDLANLSDTTSAFNKISSYQFAKVAIELPSPLPNYSGAIKLKFNSYSSSGYDLTDEINVITHFNGSGNLVDCYSNPSTDPDFTTLRKIFCEDLGADFSTNCSFRGLPLKYGTKGSCPEKNGYVLYEMTGEFQFCDTGPSWSEL